MSFSESSSNVTPAVHIIFRFGALVVAAFVISATVFSFVVIFFFNRVFDNFFFNFFVFSFRLNDEAQHLALSRLNHSFVFSTRRPCSRCIAKSRGDRGVE